MRKPARQRTPRPRASRRPKKLTLYLGWDGSYVLSKYPFHVADDGEGPFLSTNRKHSILDVSDTEARCVFGTLRLKKFEVVKIELTVREL